MTSHKTPFMEDLETVAHDLAAEIVNITEHFRETQGPVPFGQKEYDPERLAQLELPQWFVQGNATGQVARDFWDGVTARLNKPNPGMAGPKGAILYHRQMMVLWKNPKHRAAALEAMNDEQRRQLDDLVATGQHPGYARTMVGNQGQVQPLAEPGDMAQHRHGGVGVDGG